MNETWQVAGEKIIEVGSADEPVRRVSVRLIGGQIDVVAHDDPEARLEVHSVSGRPLDVSWDDHELVVAHPQARWDSLVSGLVDKLRRQVSGLDDTAEISLAVPRGTALRIGTVSADGLAVGIGGEVEVRSVSGILTLDGITGEVTAQTVSGELEARNQRGPIRVDSVSGSFTVQADGAPTVTAKTVSGSLAVDASAAALAVEFTSVSGALVVRRAGGPGYDAELRSVSGRVVVGGHRIAGNYGPVRYHQADPGAGAVVRANTVSGDITLLTQQPAAHPAQT